MVKCALMTEEVVRLSRKNQIVVPKGAREKLGLSSGDQLIVRVEENALIMKPKPRSYTRYMQGLHKDLWGSVDASEYVEGERKAWSTQKQTSEHSSRRSRQ